MVERIAATPANVNDGRAGPDALPDYPGEVFADSAYRGPHFDGAVRARGGTPRVVLNAMWGRDEEDTLGRLRDWNGPIHRLRGRIEKIFGTWKRSYGLRRMRWRGLAKGSPERSRRAAAQITSPPWRQMIAPAVPRPAGANRVRPRHVDYIGPSAQRGLEHATPETVHVAGRGGFSRAPVAGHGGEPGAGRRIR